MSDRHEKWQRVEPGTVIPAGQPYRVEVPQSGFSLGAEYIAETDRHAGEQWPTFVDSSWRPPRVHQCCGTECTTDELASNSSLVLPTEPTWGIAVYRVYNATSNKPYVEQALDEWRQDRPRESVLIGRLSRLALSPNTILNFIPLTEEQVQRIEAAQ